MTFIISLCGFIISYVLTKLDCGLTNPYFYIVFVCYVVPHTMWLIKEYKRGQK